MLVQVSVASLGGSGLDVHGECETATTRLTFIALTIHVAQTIVHLRARR